MALAEMFIEIDTRCNARCFYCDTGNQSRAAHRKWMSLETFSRVIDHGLSVGLLDTDSLIYLFDRGEPSLHPQISAIVEILNDRKLEYCISTNCGMQPRIAKSISMHGLRKLVISMPGFSQESYDRIHRLPFEKVIENIKLMLADFRSRNFEGEAVMSLHVYRFNVTELAPASEFCFENDIMFAPYYAFFNDTVWSLDYLSGKLSDNVLGRAREELFLDKITEQAKNSPANFRCPQYDRITINELGELILCCGAPRPGNDYYDGYLLGDFTKLTAEEVLRLKTTSPACKRCLSVGAAYLGTVVLRPDPEILPPERQRSRDEVVVPLASPLIDGGLRQWSAVENASLAHEGGMLRLTEERGFGYHRLLGRIDGGRPGEMMTVSMLARPAGRSRLKLELLDDGAANYSTANFNLKSGYAYSSAGTLSNASISPAADGFYSVSLRMPFDKASQVHFCISLVTNEEGVVYPGAPGRSIELQNILVN